MTTRGLAVMCALGLCMQRMGKSQQGSTATPPPTPGPDAQAVKAEAALESNTPAPGNRA